MQPTNYSCEQDCHCEVHPSQTELVVLTGGPGAGKTAVLEFIRKVLCKHVVILPESAGILFGGGFWRLPSSSAKQAAQTAIYHVQQQMQNLVSNEHLWHLGLCDRGTLDGAAYWPGEPNEYYANLNTTREHEYSKYKAVIHLRSPGRHNGYNWQNPLRVESPEMAEQIDQRIHEVWRDHPHYTRIETTVKFIDKVAEALRLIQAHIPECCKK